MDDTENEVPEFDKATLDRIKEIRDQLQPLLEELSELGADLMPQAPEETLESIMVESMATPEETATLDRLIATFEGLPQTLTSAHVAVFAAMVIAGYSDEPKALVRHSVCASSLAMAWRSGKLPTPMSLRARARKGVPDEKTTH